MRQISKRKFVVLGLLVLAVVAGFFIPRAALADTKGAIATVLSYPVLWLVTLFGRLLTIIIRLLVLVAQYTDFINSPAVSKGWIILRDICNMFFIVILLVIAFATVLRIEHYSYKRLLGGLLMAAVLVNFSKLICGFLIDIAQIVMLTFVNAFKAAAEGNFAQMLGLTKIMELRHTEPGDISGGEVLGAAVLGLIMTVVALIVVGIITIILAFRIIVLWFLILLSPLVFVAQVLPQTQRWSGMWWEKFTHQVIVGPALAFMLWLSLAVVQDQGDTLYSTVVNEEGRKTLEGEEIGAGGGQALAAAISETSKPQYLLNFIIGIAMLIGSLMVAQTLGVAGGQMAGRVVQKMQGFATGAMRAPVRLGAVIGRGAVSRLEAATGISLRPSTWKESWEARQKVVAAEREEARIEKAKAKGIPTPAQLFETYASAKGPFRLFKRFAGSAIRYRKTADSLRTEEGQLTKEMAGKMTRKEKDQRDKKINDQKIALGQKKNDLENQLNTLGLKFGTPEYDPKKAGELRASLATVDSTIKDIGRQLEMKITIMTEKEKQEKTEKLQKMIEAREGLETRAELISPSMMAYEDRIKIQQAKYEQFKRVQDIDSWQEQGKLYDQAKSRGETATMEALLMKLVQQSELNEYLQRRGFETSYKGLQGLVKKDFITDLKLPEQQAFRMGNDLSLMMKEKGDLQIGLGYKTEEGPGGILNFRETTEKEHNDWARIEASKIEDESFWRKLSRWSVFRESEKPDEKGRRVPLYDGHVKNIFEDKFNSMYTEMIMRNRMPKIVEEYFSHPTILVKLEEQIKSGEIALTPEQLKQWGEMKRRLELTQIKKWLGEEEA